MRRARAGGDGHCGGRAVYVGAGQGHGHGRAVFGRRGGAAGRGHRYVVDVGDGGYGHVRRGGHGTAVVGHGEADRVDGAKVVRCRGKGDGRGLGRGQRGVQGYGDWRGGGVAVIVVGERALRRARAGGDGHCGGRAVYVGAGQGHGHGRAVFGRRGGAAGRGHRYVVDVGDGGYGHVRRGGHGTAVVGHGEADRVDGAESSSVSG